MVNERSMTLFSRILFWLAVFTCVPLLCLFATPQQLTAASFDCKLAATPDEVAICTNDELSSLDDAVAASFRQARAVKRAIVKPISRSLLAERNACGGDIDCLRSAMTKAIGTYKSVILGEPIEAESFNRDKIPYGSRAGMEVSVISRRGLNTSRAVILVEHRREDAVSFCREYVGSVTDQCITDELKAKLENRLTGDCRTGRFTTITGQSFVFLGPKTSNADQSLSEYVLIDADTNEPLDGSMASGYPVALAQFRELCPVKAN